MVRAFLLKVLWLYQKSFSLLGHGSCRYYPSCSEYAKWQFEINPLPTAFYRTFIRILRCNQLFPGGIDYPLSRRFCEKPTVLTRDSIKYWFVPAGEQDFHIVKNFDYKGFPCSKK